MKSCIFFPHRVWHRLLLLLISSAFLGTADPLAAAGARKMLEVKLSEDRLTAKVTVPDGVESVTIQRFEREGGWRKIVRRGAVAGVMRFKLPAAGKNVRWRAIGQFAEVVGARDKFPKAFYQGKNRFGPVKADGAGRITPGKVFEHPPEAGDLGDSPIEADIWKIDGDTVYFFNQLRGLQVLDLANPADPRLTASLRLPAVGQDLYLLPGTPTNRTVVLLTESWSAKSGSRTRIHLVKVGGGTAEITFSRDVVGSLADSRMVGNRLILATTEWSEGQDSWSARTRLSEWLLASDQAPRAANEIVVEGANPLISAGPDWLALAVSPTEEWSVSDVSVFAIRPSGLVRMARPIRTAGAIAGKFGIQWRDNVLTTISEKNSSKSGWSPVTVLENFRVRAPEVVRPAVIEDLALGKLQLAKGESLFATRFAGDKVYVVTFLQTDPLWVVDLSNPDHPIVAGHIEVPGYSTHLEPIGDLLFSVGWEANTVVASLFNVANPASPQVLRRLKLGPAGSFSESLWDEQAMKILPAAGLALVPLTSYDEQSDRSKSSVQLLDIDASDLRLRGKISHDFDARRADLIGDAVVSISQRVLVAANVADRDAPEILSEVTLAWPVDRVFAAGRHLVQIEDGGWYGGGRATARISPAFAPESILAEFDLGKGTVKAADFRDGKLFILREIVAGQSLLYRSPVVGESPGNKWTFDIYDASELPALTLIGSCTTRPISGGQVARDHFLWPQPNRPAIPMDFRFSFWFARSAELAKPMKSIMLDDRIPYWIPGIAPRLIVFDITSLKSPVAGDPVILGPADSTLNGTAEAADGLIVLGSSRSVENRPTEIFESARVIEVGESGTATVRPFIDLPGQLFAVTGLDDKGFLAFTRSARELQVSASDGYQAFQIQSLGISSRAVVAAGGRRLFVATRDGIERHFLDDGGTFLPEPTWQTEVKPNSLRWVGGTLIGSNWNSLFAAETRDESVKTWRFPIWSPGVERVDVAANGDLIVPFGDYGAERLAR